MPLQGKINVEDYIIDTNNVKKIHAKCSLYNPLCETEGECWDKSIVSRLGGCDNPEDCDKCNKYFEDKIK